MIKQNTQVDSLGGWEEAGTVDCGDKVAHERSQQQKKMKICRCRQKQS